MKLGLDIIQEYGYQDCEVVLSEADPDLLAAGGICDNANMIFRNTEYYATYVASTYEKIDQLSSQYGIRVRPLHGHSCSREKGVLKEPEPLPQGIDKAVFNMFKIYGSLGNESFL